MVEMRLSSSLTQEVVVYGTEVERRSLLGGGAGAELRCSFFSALVE